MNESISAAAALQASTPGDIRRIVERHIIRIEIHSDRVMVHVPSASLIDAAIRSPINATKHSADIELKVMTKQGRTGKKVRLVAGPSSSAAT